MEEYVKWLENKIDSCLEDKDLQREHWAFSQSLKKYRELALCQPSVNSSVCKELKHCKEEWASNYDKTWEDVQHDFEYSIGVSKLYSFEQVMDIVAELYCKQCH